MAHILGWLGELLPIIVAVVEEIGKLKQPPRQRKTHIGFYSEDK